jgi:hypothetical protein
MCCGMCVFRVLGALERVQHLVPNVYTRPRFMLASEWRRVFNIANNAAIDKVQFWREIELDRHVPPNNRSTEKFRRLEMATESTPARHVHDPELIGAPKCRIRLGRASLAPAMGRGGHYWVWRLSRFETRIE